MNENEQEALLKKFSYIPYLLGGGLNQTYNILKCLHHKKRIVIVWSGQPIVDCDDEKCVNQTIKRYWKNEKRQAKKWKHLEQQRKTKRKIKNFIQKKEPYYDGYISFSLIEILIKLKVLETKKKSNFQIQPLLKIKPNMEPKLSFILKYIINNLNAKLMNCCSMCRFEDEKKFKMMDKQKNEILSSIWKTIEEGLTHKEIHTFSWELGIKLENFNILIDSDRFENLIMEKYKMRSLKMFNYISLSIATIISFTSLIITILQLGK